MSTLRNRALAFAAVLGVSVLIAGGVRAAQTDSSAAPAAPAAGAARQGRRGGQRGAQQSPVEVALKAVDLTADQQTKLKDLQTKHAEDLKAVTDRTTPEGRAKIKDINDKYLADVKGLLTADQTPKFQTAYDNAELWASQLGRPLSTLNLTDDEKTKITPILKDEWSQVSDLKGAERRTKMESVITDLKAKVRPLLTSDQQTSLDSLNFTAPRGGRRRNADGAAPAPAAPAATTTPAGS